ncbi:MAG: ABC transporter ATP-binding protein [Nitrososphaeria archaeon]
MVEPILSVEKLDVSFSTFEGLAHVLSKVTFKINHKEVFALVGETGCGKTVTALSIIKLLPRNSYVQGRIIFNGRNILELKESDMVEVRGKSMAMILQDPSSSLNPMFKVGEQLCDAITSNDPNIKEPKRYALELLSKVGFKDTERVFNSYPNELSGGMQQRVAISISLTGKPTLLIADEPTTALDVLTQAQIIQLLKQVRDTYSTSVLLITHNLGLVATLCDRVGIMYFGQVVEIGPTYDLFYNTKHPYTKGLLQSLPYNKLKNQTLPTIPGDLPSPLSPPSGCRFYPRCPRSNESCSKDVPEILPITDKHYVACFNPLSGDE